MPFSANMSISSSSTSSDDFCISGDSCIEHVLSPFALACFLAVHRHMSGGQYPDLQFASHHASVTMAAAALKLPQLSGRSSPDRRFVCTCVASSAGCGLGGSGSRSSPARRMARRARRARRTTTIKTTTEELCRLTRRAACPCRLGRQPFASARRERRAAVSSRRRTTPKPRGARRGRKLTTESSPLLLLKRSRAVRMAMAMTRTAMAMTRTTTKTALRSGPRVRRCRGSAGGEGGGSGEGGGGGEGNGGDG